MVMAGASGAAPGAAITRRINASGTTARGTAAGSGPRHWAASARWRVNQRARLTAARVQRVHVGSGAAAQRCCRAATRARSALSASWRTPSIVTCTDRD